MLQGFDASPMGYRRMQREKANTSLCDLCRTYLWLSSLPTGCHYCSTEIHPWTIYVALRADSKDHLLAANWKFLIVFAGVLYIYIHFAIEFYIKVHRFIVIRKESIAKASAVMTLEVQIVSHEKQPAEKLAVIILKPLVLIIILLLCSCWRWSQHCEWTLPVSSNLLSTLVISSSQRCAFCVMYYFEIALEYSKRWVNESPSNPLARRMSQCKGAGLHSQYSAAVWSRKLPQIPHVCLPSFLCLTEKVLTALRIFGVLQ